MGKFCVNCGAGIHEKAELCPQCGVRQPGPVMVTASKSKIAAALLAFFLGGLGVHKFYLNQTGQGLIILVGTLVSAVACFVVVGFVGLFLIGAWVLVDFFRYLFMSDAAFAARYSR